MRALKQLLFWVVIYPVCLFAGIVYQAVMMSEWKSFIRDVKESVGGKRDNSREEGDQKSDKTEVKRSDASFVR